MTFKKRNFKILFRLIIWIFYLSSGCFLYLESFIWPIYLAIFSKLVFPLSIFWLQIRIKNKEPWLPFTNEMSTSQLWFKLIPILASLLTFLLVSVNLIFKVVLFL